MNCLFCHRPTVENLNHSDSVYWHVYNCDSCSAVFNFEIKEERITSYHFKHDGYLALFWLTEKTCDIWHWNDKKIEWAFVKKIRFLPNITPSNFPQKLATILTFM